MWAAGNAAPPVSLPLLRAVVSDAPRPRVWVLRVALPAVAFLAALSLARAQYSPEPLDLDTLLAEADTRSPEILAARARAAAAQHVPSQMEALPDPMVSVAYTNDTVTGLTLGSSEFTTLTFAWTQDVPYPGKRRMAGDVGRAGLEVSGQALEATRLRVRSEVKQAYVELHRAESAESVLRESRKLLESFLQTARGRYESGQGILENVLKAQTELTKLDARLADNAQQRRRAQVSLNSLVGRIADSPLGPALRLPAVELPEREAAERAAADRSPEVLFLRAEARQEESRLELARRSLKPDFTWQAAYMNRGGLDPMVMGMLGVRLPLHKKTKQAEAVVQAEHELEAARQEVEGGQVRILSEVRDLIALAERAEALARLYEEGIIPQARSALDSAAASYAVGKAEFITLINDFLTVLDGELEDQTQRAEKARSLAALERFTGATYVLAGSSAGSVSGGGSHE